MKILMSILGIFLCSSFLFQPGVEATVKRCTVVRRISGCDYFIVQSTSDYAVLEWYGGHDPDKDDKLIGNFENYGMKTLIDETSDSDIRVWVEEYGLTKTDALEKLVDKCE